ncbi:OmpA family protein [Bermanella sp. R86510]|uniref:flagellar protein MotY n=1 Tax=unclassified Bermanella TaxID=2627862 RepID=UPI0037C804F4
MRLLVCLLLSVYASGVLALMFQAPVEKTEWRLSPSIFECEFTQPIPNYGEAVFYHEAGEDLLFHLRPKKQLMAPGKAALHIEPPQWLPSHMAEDLGLLDVTRERRTVMVDHDRANKMMQSLMQGLRPTFTRRARYDGQESIRVAVSPANFNNFYNDYLGCVAGLLPVNFGQVARSKVLFSGGGSGLTPEAKKALDMLILYVKADPEVEAIYIDGHSDSAGRRYNNRRLSEERALRVNEYLIDRGLDPSLITTRYHGERYPVASNNTAAGRAQNRRVTIRLEKPNEELEARLDY